MSVYRSICKGPKSHYNVSHTVYLRTMPQKEPLTHSHTDRTVTKWTYTSFYLHPYLCHHLSGVSPSLSSSLQSISLSYSSDKWLAVGDNHRSLNTSNICRAVLQSLTTRDKTHTVSLTHTYTILNPAGSHRMGSSVQGFALCIRRWDFKDGLDMEVGKMRDNTHTHKVTAVYWSNQTDSFMALTHKSRRNTDTHMLKM